MIQWTHVYIDNSEIGRQFLQTYQRNLNNKLVTASAFDTETTGLHPIVDKPFLFQCGYYNKEQQHGVIAIVDIEKKPRLAHSFISHWNKLTQYSPLYLGHHIIFDLHMITNIDEPYTYYKNVSDTQFYIRASSDAIQTNKGGEPLELKKWANRHIRKDADANEKELAKLRTAKAKEYNDKLRLMTGWKAKQFDDFFKDKLNDYTDLPEKIKEKYIQWHRELPEYLQKKVHGRVEGDDIRYSEIDRSRVIEYGFFDIEFTLEIHNICAPVIDCRDNWKQVELENANIPVFFEMERVGFKVDKDYLKLSAKRMKEYTLMRREDLCILAGEKVTCNQHKELLRILKDKFNIVMTSCGADPLELKCNELKRDKETNAEAIEFIETIMELRTLEKWYSTYIRKFDYQLELSDRIYTSIHQVGAVSGRITCDFQQFPKAGIVDNQGNELFDPRRMVTVDEEYPMILYQDYSAQELRVQALMTYLVGTPDMNMLRAYCPWKCHTADGVQYDPENKEHPKHAYDWEWFQDEDNKPWKPTDLHGAMTKNIFKGITEDDPTFHDKRYIGKRANFMKTYGGGYQCVRDAFPDFSDELCHAIDEAYYKTYPGVKGYHEFCFDLARCSSYAENLYGVKYYGVQGHNLRNMLIQGSCAYMTKDRQVALYNLLKDKKSKFVMPIHDEVQIYIHKDEMDADFIWQIRELMGDIDSQVPIVSDTEVTFTNWKEKFEVGTKEEMRKVLEEHKVA